VGPLFIVKSEKLKLVGRVDEVLFFKDGTAAPLDYKYAEYEERIYKTHLIQQACYTLLIEETFQCPAHKAYICYVRSNNFLKEIIVSEALKKRAIEIVDEIFDILNENYFPAKTKSKARCLDCTYRNICVK
jgi:CRISPR-associated exonuclease Cas4